MTAPTLRCLACGYDITSLVETRGRDEPGVCPECGEDLHESVLERPGSPVQRRGQWRDYLTTVYLATVKPSSLVNSMRLGEDITGGLCFAHCFIAGGVVYILSLAVGCIAWAIEGDFAALGYAMLVGVGVALGAGFGMMVLLLPTALISMLAARAVGVRDTRLRVWGALDIGAVWMIWWPLIFAPGYILGFVMYDFVGELAGVITFLIVAFGPPLMVVLQTTRALIGLRHHPVAETVDAPNTESKRPAPSNLP